MKPKPTETENEDLVVEDNEDGEEGDEMLEEEAEEEEEEYVYPSSTRRFRNFAQMKQKLLYKSRWEPALRDCVPLQDRPEYNPKANKNIIVVEPEKKTKKVVTDDDISIM